MATLKTLLPLALSLPFFVACGGGNDGPGEGPDVDQDRDGFTPNQGDCDDLNASVYPDAPDPCDNIDQNCDGKADELFDQDNDNFTSCGGDCRDNDPNSNPAAVETVDGFDNDCDGIIDNHTPDYDDDGDGYTENQGDCNDDPNADGAKIGPGAIEVAVNSDGEPELIDNDCDELIDEAIDPCPEDLEITDPLAFAAAIDVCHEVANASHSEFAEPASRNISSTFGNTYVPFAGPTFIELSSGLATDALGEAYAGHNHSFGITIPHPDPQPGNPADVCVQDDPDQVRDPSDLILTLRVPSNAESFSFDFNFMSLEFAEFVCQEFDDSFIAYLDSGAFNGNISFDSTGNPITINNNFFNICNPNLDSGCTGEADLIGTGFESGLTSVEPFAAAQDGAGGGTGWLTTTAAVIPGEVITLRFIVWDEFDDILDSAVLIDNFRWGLDTVDGPITIDRRFDPTANPSASDNDLITTW